MMESISVVAHSGCIGCTSCGLHEQLNIFYDRTAVSQYVGDARNTFMEMNVIVLYLALLKPKAVHLISSHSIRPDNLLFRFLYSELTLLCS